VSWPSATGATKGPLAGVKIVDLTSVVVGPAATLLLAEQGADVIKVEAPGGDLMRKLGGTAVEPVMSPKFLHFNRNKRSIELDLKGLGSRHALLRLLSSADVFISNMRPRALATLGLGWITLNSINDQLIHCTITGFKSGGPYEGAPAYDTIIQGLSGVAACQEAVLGEPRFAPFVLADHVIGFLTAQAVTAALFARTRSGVGEAVEVPMFENMAAFVLAEHLGQRTFDPEGHFGDKRIFDPNARPLATLDGYICVSPNTDQQARGFFSAIGRPELGEEPRFATVQARLKNVDAFFELRAAEIAKKTSAEWLELFRQYDVPAMRMNTLADLVVDPQLRGSGTLVCENDGTLGLRHVNTYSHSGVAEPRPAPRLDEHGESIRSHLRDE
jgi:crotonobetainyl-CoA:carnitine CoA-transferase CaiB-like acyl-CoA transferase